MASDNVSLAEQMAFSFLRVVIKGIVFGRQKVLMPPTDDDAPFRADEKSKKLIRSMRRRMEEINFAAN
jgi:hypothetical protein